MAWGFYAPITIDHTKCGTANSSDFPVCVTGTYDGTGTEPDLRVVASGGNITSASGYDIGFYSDEALTTALKYERELHTVATGEIIYWVKVPTISYETDTVIYMAYGDDGVTTDQQDAVNTWNSNFKGVWHFNDASGTTVNDSTTNGNDLTATRTNILNNASGKIGKKAVFVAGSSDRCDGADLEADYVLSGAYSMATWIQCTSVADGAAFWSCSYMPSNNYQGIWMWSNSGGASHTLYHWRPTTAQYNVASDTVDVHDGEWHRFVTSYDGTSNMTLYIDGVAHGVQTSGGDAAFSTTHNYFILGAKHYEAAISGYFSGSLCQTFLLNGYQYTSSWALTEYNNQNSPATFYAMGDEAEAAAPLADMTINMQKHGGVRVY